MGVILEQAVVFAERLVDLIPGPVDHLGRDDGTRVAHHEDGLHVEFVAQPGKHHVGRDKFDDVPPDTKELQGMEVSLRVGEWR
jgi:hypothetical protein